MPQPVGDAPDAERSSSGEEAAAAGANRRANLVTLLQYCHAGASKSNQSGRTAAQQAPTGDDDVVVDLTSHLTFSAIPEPGIRQPSRPPLQIGEVIC